MSTIAAISTPDLAGGIAVIRISGEDAIGVASRIFKPFSEKPVSSMAGYTCAYGIAHDAGERLDDCVLTIFRAPHSYTGEDVCEISCHGGLFVTRRILRTALKNGAESAGAGEFTKRAYLNGKLDLTQAEAVMDIISARGEAELKIAEELRGGAAFKKAKACSSRLMVLLGALAAWADYPDEDIPAVEPENLAAELISIRGELDSLVRNYDSGRLLREGIRAVIVGRPNVGKSTFFNALSGYERSIVTDIAGTTRDVIEETVRLGDIILRLSDTAGIRETNDIIEELGVGMSEKLIDQAQLVIAVFDGGCPLTEDDKRVIDRISGRKCIAVINKSDVPQLIDSSYIEQKLLQTVYISAKDQTGIDKFKNIIENMFTLDPQSLSIVTVANERQKSCIDSCMRCIDEAIGALGSGEFLDAVNVLLDEAEQNLLELTGERVTNAVVDEVFSHFCVGK